MLRRVVDILLLVKFKLSIHTELLRSLLANKAYDLLRFLTVINKVCNCYNFSMFSQDIKEIKSSQILSVMI